jgi:hypothetical protein
MAITAGALGGARLPRRKKSEDSSSASRQPGFLTQWQCGAPLGCRSGNNLVVAETKSPPTECSSTRTDEPPSGSALDGLTSGNFNIAIGAAAGTNLVGSESNNIYIGNAGVASESNIIRIGNTDILNGPVQTAAFVAGINGATSASGTAVLVSSKGQLGTILSSRRFKDDIADMGNESDLLMKLRPVAFYYKPELDPTHTRQYGLVAEEVAQVSPELVVFDKDGVPQTVRYHFVNAMLLNEVQKQRQLVEEQQSTITRQKVEIQDLAARLAKLEALVAPAP